MNTLLPIPNFQIPTVLDAWPESAAPPVYPYLHGCRRVGEKSQDSPDPLRDCVWDDCFVDNPLEPLQCYAILPVGAVVESGTATGLETLARPGSCVELRGDVTLQLDFGVESAGWLEFESNDLPEPPVCSVSEYNRPGVVNAGAQSPQKTGIPERIGRTWRLKLNDLYYEGMRFAWVRVKAGDRRVALHNLRAVCQIKPANSAGAFHSSEPLLNRIWETGAYAVKLNLHEDYFGSILVERGDRHSWTGDAYVTQAASLPAFGNFSFVRQNTRRMQDDDNGIESYAIYWVLALTDYVLWSGDSGFWQEQIERTTKKLEHAATVASRPNFLGYAAFCGHDDRLGGFAEDTPEGNRRVYIALARRAALAVLTILDALPPAEGSDRLRNAAQSLIAFAKEYLLARESLLELHDGTEAILAGLPEDVAAREALASRIYSDPIRAVSYSPFNGYFVLEGMARAGAWQAAGALLDRCWGGMLRLGATTFWESFRPEWLGVMAPNDPIFCGTQGFTSLCHPWSAGPTRWLSDHVLGIRPTAPGFSRIRIAPNQGMVEAVRGCVPTPRGPVKIERAEGAIHVSLPEGMTGEGPEGETLHPGNSTIPSPSRPPKVILHGFGARHEWDWLPDGDPTQDPGEQWAWIAYAAAEGNDVRSGFEGAKFHVFSDIEGDVKVPEGTIPGGALARSSLARREPWPNRDHAPRLLRGALRGRSPRPCQQTIRIRVVGDLSHVQEVALWFADPAKEKIILSVDVLAEPGRYMVLPTRKVEHFSDGRVLRFRPRGPFLLRVCNRIDSPDTTLSGIAFKCRP